MNDCTQVSKETKQALSAVFGSKNVSVRMDRGTAYGWINARVMIDKPMKCECQENYSYCTICDEARKEANEKINEAVKNIKFGRYTDDMGYDHDEFISQVEFHQSVKF